MHVERGATSSQNDPSLISADFSNSRFQVFCRFLKLGGEKVSTSFSKRGGLSWFLEVRGHPKSVQHVPQNSNTPPVYNAFASRQQYDRLHFCRVLMLQPAWQNIPPTSSTYLFVCVPQTLSNNSAHPNLGCCFAPRLPQPPLLFGRNQRELKSGSGSNLRTPQNNYRFFWFLFALFLT